MTPATLLLAALIAAAPLAPALAAPADAEPREPVSGVGLPEPPKASKRSSAQRRAFVRAHPCPAPADARPDGTRCPGFRVDHIVPLACGGADRPHNMQWLTTEAWRAKSTWERKGCGR